MSKIFKSIFKILTRGISKKTLTSALIVFSLFISLKATDKIKFTVTLYNGEDVRSECIFEFASGDSVGFHESGGELWQGSYSEGTFFFDCYYVQFNSIDIRELGNGTHYSTNGWSSVPYTIKIENFTPLPKFPNPIVINTKPGAAFNYTPRLKEGGSPLIFYIHQDGVEDGLIPPPEYLSWSAGKITGTIPESPFKYSFQFNVKAENYAGSGVGIVTVNVSGPNATGVLGSHEVPESEEDDPTQMRFSTRQYARVNLDHFEDSGTLELSISGGNGSKFAVYTNSETLALPLGDSYILPVGFISLEHSLHGLALPRGNQTLYIYPIVEEGKEYENVTDGVIKLTHINSEGKSSADEVHFQIYDMKLDLTGNRTKETPGTIAEDDEEKPSRNIIDNKVAITLKQKNIDSGTLSFKFNTEVLKVYKDSNCTQQINLSDCILNMDPTVTPASTNPLAALYGTGERTLTLYMKPLIPVSETEVNLSWNDDGSIVSSDTIYYKIELKGVNVEAFTEAADGTATAIASGNEEQTDKFMVGRKFQLKLDPGAVTTGTISLVCDDSGLYDIYTDSARTHKLPSTEFQYTFGSSSSSHAFNAFASGQPVTLYFTTYAPIKSTSIKLESSAFKGGSDSEHSDDDTTNNTDNNNAGLDIVTFEIDLKKADVQGVKPGIATTQGFSQDRKVIDDNELDHPEKDLKRPSDPEENGKNFTILASDEPEVFSTSDMECYYAKLILKPRDINIKGYIKLEIEPSKAVTIFSSSGNRLKIENCKVDVENPSGPLAGLASGDVTLFLKGVKPGDVKIKLISSIRSLKPDGTIKSADAVDILNLNVKSFCPCTQCVAGDSSFFNSSIAGTISLGNFDYGEPVGEIGYYSKELNENCAHPSNLNIVARGNIYLLNSANQIVDGQDQVVTIDPAKAAVVYYKDDYSPNTALRKFPAKIFTPETRIDFSYDTEVYGSNPYVKSMTMQFYKTSDNSLFRTITMTNTFTYDSVAGTFNTTSFKVENTFGGTTNTQEFTKNTSGDIQLSTDGIISSVKEEINGDVTTKTYYSGPQSAPASVSVEKYQNFDWGTSMIESTSGGQTTTYEYYNDKLNDGCYYGNIKKITYPRGNYDTYTYDNSGQEKERISYRGGKAYKNTVVKYEIVKINGAVGEYLVDSSSGKANYTVADTDTFSMVGRKEITTNYCDNVITSKSGYVTYYDYSYAPDQSILYDENDNALITYTYKISDNTSDFFGKVSKVVSYDGSGSINSYAKETDPIHGELEVLTSYRGELAGDNNSVVDGIKTITKTTRGGTTIYSASYDIVTNTKLSEETAITVDGFGRITKTQYMDGTFSERSYGCCGVDWEIDRNGARTDYLYDNATKRLISSARNGITTHYTYDDAGNTLSTTVKGRNDAEITSSSAYDSNGVLVSNTDPMGYVTSYTNNGDTVTYPNSTTSITNYNQGEVSGISGTAVHAVTYSSGPDWKKTMPQNVTVYTDKLGRNYKTVYADNTYTETFYNSKGQAVKQVTPGGKITLTEYDGRGRVYRSAVDMDLNGIIDGNDEITQYTYAFGTKNSKTVSVTTATRIVGSNSKVLSVSESVIGGMESWTTSNGLTSHSLTERLGNGQLKSTVENPDDSKIITYSTYGLTTKVENYNQDGSAGNYTEYAYDEFDRVTTITEKYGSTVINEIVNSDYNANGQPLTVTTNGKATTYVYDNMGRRTSVTLPGGRTVTYTYKNTGELDTVDGAETYKQSYDYDNQGRMHTLSTFKDGTTPQATTWNYNDRGFLTSKIYADNKGTTYTYTADGQLATRVWARGITTGYTYDNAGRQLTVDYSDTTPDITYTYDWMGNVATVEDAAGTRTFTYDYVTSGHPGLVSETIPSILNYNISYTYDAYGRKTGMSLKNGSMAVFGNSYGYDSVTGRLTSVGDGTYTAHYTYQDGTGLMTQNQIKRDSDSAVITTHNRTYDTRLNNYHLLSVSNTTGATTHAYSYVYNDKDQRTKLTLADGTYWEYTYDDKGQVISGIKKDAAGNAIAGQNFGYEYDGIGNRKWYTRGLTEMKMDYTSNSINQYTQIDTPGVVPVIGEADLEAAVKALRTDEVPVTSGQQSIVTVRSGKYFSGGFTDIDNTAGPVTVDYNVYAIKQDTANNKELIRKIAKQYTIPKRAQALTYDDDGNMLTNGDWTYTWNGENRKIAAEKSDMKLEFVYDFMGRRIIKKVYTGSAGNWTLASEKKFVYNGYKQIAEFDASDVLQKTYTWQPVDLDVPLWVKDGSNYYYYIVDGNKNVRAMVDSSNNIVAEYDYNPFGKVVVSSGAYKDTNKYRFSSEYKDDETGLVYYNYRYYKSETGRWINRDPIEEAGGENLYGIVSNNVVNQCDLLGLSWWEKLKKQKEKELKEKVLKVKKLYNANKLQEAAEAGRDMYALLAAGGNWTGYTMASTLMMHWLDLNRAKDDFEMTQTQLAKVFSNDAVEDSLIYHFYHLHKEMMQLTKEKLTPIRTSYDGGRYVPDKDIHFSLGVFTVYFTGDYCFNSRTPRKMKVEIDGTFEIEDKYDWQNPGEKYVPIRGNKIYDKWAENVENKKLAKEFKVKGEYTFSNRLVSQNEPLKRLRVGAKK